MGEHMDDDADIQLGAGELLCHGARATSTPGFHTNSQLAAAPGRLTPTAEVSSPFRIFLPNSQESSSPIALTVSLRTYGPSL